MSQSRDAPLHFGLVEELQWQAKVEQVAAVKSGGIGNQMHDQLKFLGLFQEQISRVPVKSGGD